MSSGQSTFICDGLNAFQARHRRHRLAPHCPHRIVSSPSPPSGRGARALLSPGHLCPEYLTLIYWTLNTRSLPHNTPPGRPTLCSKFLLRGGRATHVPHSLGTATSPGAHPPCPPDASSRYIPEQRRREHPAHAALLAGSSSSLPALRGGTRGLVPAGAHGTATAPQLPWRLHPQRGPVRGPGSGADSQQAADQARLPPGTPTEDLCPRALKL